VLSSHLKVYRLDRLNRLGGTRRLPRGRRGRIGVMTAALVRICQ
jgi:hypothetical protein